MRLLIVDDNYRLSMLLADRLRARGFCCDTAGTLRRAEQTLDNAAYDLLILDLGLPDGDGLDWLVARRSAKGVPLVLILTARDALEDRVTGLDAGADDYLVKPFEVDELAARIRALLRRPGQRTETIMKSGPIAFEVATRTTYINNERVELSRREADLLELLIRRAGSVVPRESIESKLYSFDGTFTPNAVEAVMSRLRRKIDLAGGEGILHTVRGIGYLLKESV